MANNGIQATEDSLSVSVLTSQALLEHWQGHRQLTRRIIEVFPEEAFFHYSIGGMRPFAEMVMEMIEIADLGSRGVATGEWPEFSHQTVPETKSEMLQRWDEVTRQLDSIWPQIPPQRFSQEESAFGLYEGIIYSHILYFIDNEIHHRGQGYVYLRSLGIEPTPFWQRD